MDNKQEDSSKNKRTEYVAEASVKQDKKTWDEWSRELNIRSSIVRGACVSVKADPEVPVTKSEFMKAVSGFGSKRHGGSK